MVRKLFLTALACLACLASQAQIVNRLRVDRDTFIRYAYGRMQQFNPDNLALADSLYVMGGPKEHFRYKCRCHQDHTAAGICHHTGRQIRHIHRQGKRQRSELPVVHQEVRCYKLDQVAGS